MFIEINVVIVFEKIFAIFVIKKQDFVVLITSNYLRFNKDNLNINFCNCSNKEEVFLKNSKFFFGFFFVNLVIFRL